MQRSYPLGDEVAATATFINTLTGVPTNPTNVVFSLRDPDGIVTTPGNISNPRVGVYMCPFTPGKPGWWTLRWKATGAVNAAIENRFEVTPSAFPNP